MSKQERHLYEFGPYRLIPEERLLLRGEEPVQLTPKAFDTLLVLVRRGGRLVEKDDFLNEVWAGTSVEESNVAQNILALRRALGDAEGGGKYIETVPKRGYRFLASVRVVEVNGDELFVGQHVAARTDARPSGPAEPEPPQNGLASEGAAEGQPVTYVPHGDAVAPEGSRQALRRAAGELPAGRARPGTRRAAVAFVCLAAALTLAALLYRRLWPAAPPSPFQTMKITRLTTSGKVFNATISPDGKYVVYATLEGNRQGLWMRQVATQSQVQVLAPAEVAYTGLTFTPDSNYIYYSIISRAFQNRALFRVPTLGGEPKKMLENLHPYPVSFSPDGRQFAFVRNTPGKESALLIANADGTGERKLVSLKTSGVILSPAWSPDGLRIAYAAVDYAGNDATLFEAQVADGAARPLTARRWLRIRGVSWLSDGSGLIMLCSTGPEFDTQIWQLSYPEGEARRVTNDLINYGERLSLTADSQTLAAVTSLEEANIWVAPVGDSSRARPVTSGPGINEVCVAWTPDGRIVYHSDESGADDIWMVNDDGTGRKQLTSDARLNQCPAVSPDGRTIVFLSDRTGSPHLWRMNTDGSDQRQLTDGPSGEQNPQFSSDGRWLVYRTSVRPTVYKMPAGGGDPVQLTDKMSMAPQVSPDSRLVTYLFRDDNDRMNIAVAPLEGGEPLQTFPLPPRYSFVGGALKWTPDGRAVAYVESSDGVSNVVAQPLDGGPKRQLTDFKDGQLFSFAFSPDGKQLALSRGKTSRDVVLIKDFR